MFIFLQVKFKWFLNEWFSACMVWQLCFTVFNHKEREIKSIVCFPVFKAMFQVVSCWLVEMVEWIFSFLTWSFYCCNGQEWSQVNIIMLENSKLKVQKTLVKMMVFRHGGDFLPNFTFFVNSFGCSRDLHKQYCTRQRPHICTAYHAKMVVKAWKLTKLWMIFQVGLFAVYNVCNNFCSFAIYIT
jgi:hypothetical protein